MKIERLIICMFLLILLGCQETKINNQFAETKSEKRENMQEQFLKAIKHGDIEEVNRLLASGMDINSRDSQGRTALMNATYANNVQLAEILINNGADVNLQDHMKNSPFLYAGAEGYLDILKLTIKAGADPSILNRYGGTALIPASEHGYVEVVKVLLEQTEVNVNHVNNLGWTALMEAVILSNGGKRQQETIKLLIEHGADVNIPDSDGVTPLQHAEDRGFSEIRDILLEAGAK